MQVAGADGTSKANALVGVRTDEKRAAAVLIPSRLIVDLPGSGSVAFGEALGLPDKEAPAKALTDLLGVHVDGGWVLTQAGLAALVDKVGGVPAEVDVDVVTKAADGTDTVVVRAGSQHLDGAAAAAYATYAAPEEPEQARLARFYDVLDGVLRGLPDQTREIEGTVTSLKAWVEQHALIESAGGDPRRPRRPSRSTATCSPTSCRSMRSRPERARSPTASTPSRRQR